MVPKNTGRQGGVLTTRYVKQDLTHILRIRQCLEGLEGLLDHNPHVASHVGILSVLEARIFEELINGSVTWVIRVLHIEESWEMV